ncbi:MAG: hypothetical protein VW931_04715 [Alphaproteobacteria bacterium]
MRYHDHVYGTHTFAVHKGTCILTSDESIRTANIFANTRVLEQGPAEFFAYSGTK